MSEIKKPQAFSHLSAITSIDGRFRGRVEKFSAYFSEYATIKGRVFVEIEYLIALTKVLKIALTKADVAKLGHINSGFTLKDAEEIWATDYALNHDTKAVEVYLSKKFKTLKLDKLINYIHFGLTSTDIDNTAFALSLKSFRDQVLIPHIEKFILQLSAFARENKHTVMLARTHGQIGVPTTAGKEISNFVSRLKYQSKLLGNIKIGSKMTGAVGNFNALVAAFPKVDWQKFTDNFLTSLGLEESYRLTTQVEPYDHKVEFLQAVKRVNLITQSLDEDIWRYLALGYLALRDEAGHVGSSTMPQKINPIGFEMSENYANLANGIFDVTETRLPRNRWQRDLTDKYLLRDVGQALVMSVLSYESVTDSLKQVGFNKKIIEADLNNHWEAISEGIQTILRTTTYTMPYEKLKELTRGKVVTRETYLKFIEEIKVSQDVKAKLRALSPKTYIGLAEKISL